MIAMYYLFFMGLLFVKMCQCDVGLKLLNNKDNEYFKEAQKMWHKYITKCLYKVLEKTVSCNKIVKLMFKMQKKSASFSQNKQVTFK